MRIILGIGLNVNARDFPPDIHATSLLRELASPVVSELDRNALAHRLLASLHTEFRCLDGEFSAAIAEVRERSWLIGRQIRARAPQGESFGRVPDLNEQGHLILEFPDGSSPTLTSADDIRQA